jgi:hypothetical protein
MAMDLEKQQPLTSQAILKRNDSFVPKFKYKMNICSNFREMSVGTPGSPIIGQVS